MVLSMELLYEIAASSWQLFRESAPYVLLGFLVAGVLRAFIGPDTVARFFMKGRYRSVLYASLVGVPVPL